ncbi:MAG: hypothetical protein IJT94_00105, partial [Oscillibacter sp.]|nr:hypothetical protein [Oscillibacter sp.]
MPGLPSSAALSRNGVLLNQDSGPAGLNGGLELVSSSTTVPSSGGWEPQWQQTYSGYTSQEAESRTAESHSILLPDTMRRRREEAMDRQTRRVQEDWTPEDLQYVFEQEEDEKTNLSGTFRKTIQEAVTRALDRRYDRSYGGEASAVRANTAGSVSPSTAADARRSGPAFSSASRPQTDDRGFPTAAEPQSGRTSPSGVWPERRRDAVSGSVGQQLVPDSPSRTYDSSLRTYEEFRDGRSGVPGDERSRADGRISGDRRLPEDRRGMVSGRDAAGARNRSPADSAGSGAPERLETTEPEESGEPTKDIEKPDGAPEFRSIFQIDDMPRDEASNPIPGERENSLVGIVPKDRNLPSAGDAPTVGIAGEEKAAQSGSLNEAGTGIPSPIADSGSPLTLMYRNAEALANDGTNIETTGNAVQQTGQPERLARAERIGDGPYKDESHSLEAVHRSATEYDSAADHSPEIGHGMETSYSPETGRGRETSYSPETSDSHEAGNSPAMPEATAVPVSREG